MMKSLGRRLSTKRDKSKDTDDSSRIPEDESVTSASPRRGLFTSNQAALDNIDENRNIESEPPEWVKREYQAVNSPVPSLPPSGSSKSLSSHLVPGELEVMKVAAPTPEMDSLGEWEGTPSSPTGGPSAIRASNSIKRTFSKRLGRGHGRRDSIVTEMLLGLGDQIKAIDIKNTRMGEETIGMGVISDVREVGSYTWMEGGDNDQAIISVPGMPDKWNPPRGTIGLLRPSSKAVRHPEMIDYNALRIPSAPLEPIFHSLTEDALEGIQMIADRAILRKLHLFCSLTPSDSTPTDFRFDAEAMGNVVLLTRWEPASRRKQQVMGLSYVPSLMETLTARSPGVDDEAGTMGLVRYKLGHLDMLVRFEVDAAVEIDSKKNMMSDDDEPDAPSLGSSSNLTVKPHYHPHTPQEHYMDIKVVSSGVPLDLEGIYANMVYAQSPRICIAEHSKGAFKSPEILELHGSEMRQVAIAQEETVTKVAVILGKVMELTKKHDKVVVICREGVVAAYKVSKGGRGCELSEEAVNLLKSQGARGSLSPREEQGGFQGGRIQRSGSVKFWKN